MVNPLEEGERWKVEDWSKEKNVHESKVEKMNAKNVVETASRVESYIVIEAEEIQD
jgi:hypothetical protein